VDSKSILQEKIQALSDKTLSYKLISESGPEHDKRFEVAIYINDECMATAEGHSKKDAEQKAAYSTLKKLQAKNSHKTHTYNFKKLLKLYSDLGTFHVLLLTET
jgi:dsRNA-specific ribonuclease